MTTPRAEQVTHGGLIIGRFGSGAMTDDTTKALQEAVAALNRHHERSLQIRPSTIHIVGPLPHGQSSKAAVVDIHGTVLRVLSGAGILRVGSCNLSVDCGDWVFIPSGAIYTCTGAVMQGMNLRFATAHLMRA